MQNSPLRANFAFMCYLKYLEGALKVEHKVGDRVLYVVRFSHLAKVPPGGKLIGTIVGVHTNNPSTYRIDLDAIWDEGVTPHFHGRKITVGNVPSNQIRALNSVDFVEEFF